MSFRSAVDTVRMVNGHPNWVGLVCLCPKRWSIDMNATYFIGRSEQNALVARRPYVWQVLMSMPILKNGGRDFGR